jgi:gliding motility-associated-like protein
LLTHPIKILLVIYCIGIKAYAQNLVSNGGFEMIKSCPTWENSWVVNGYDPNGAPSNSGFSDLDPGSITINNAIGWMGITKHFDQPDYESIPYNAWCIHSCYCVNEVYNSTFPYRVRMCRTSARTGSGKARIDTYMYNLNYPVSASENYGTGVKNQYIENVLVSPLVKGKVYYFEMYVLWNQGYGEGLYTGLAAGLSAINSLGVHFSEDTLQTNEYLAYFNPPVLSDISDIRHTGSFLTNNVNWTKISGCYKARGGEKFMTIGNFQGRNEIKMLPMHGYAIPWSSASYYIDDVSLTLTNYTDSILPADTAFCEGQAFSLRLNAYKPYAYQCLWNNGSTVFVKQVTVPGKYSVQVNFENTCVINDTINIGTIPFPHAVLNDTTLCNGQALNLDVYQQGCTYKWNDGSTSPQKQVDSQGVYQVRIDRKGCAITDSINLSFHAPPVFSLGNDTAICSGQQLQLGLDIDSLSERVLWDDNSILSTRVINDSGKYWVKVSDSVCTTVDEIHIGKNPLPVVNLGNDTFVCENINLVLDAANSGASYLWQDGSSLQYYNAKNPSMYKVTVTSNDGCIAVDSVSVSHIPKPIFDLGGDTALCEGTPVLLTATVPGGFYRWQNGTTGPTLLVNSQGKYVVTVKQGLCIVSDSVNVYYQRKTPFSLGNDAAYCFDQPVVLKAPSADKYKWQDGKAMQNYEAAHAGTYWVEVNIGYCKMSDTIVLRQNPVPIVFLGDDHSICREQTQLLDAKNEGSTYLWDDNTTTQTRTIIPPGLFTVKVTNGEGCNATDSININTFAPPSVSIGNDTFVCGSEEYLLSPDQSFTHYLWHNGSTEKRMIATIPGIYWLMVTDENACTAIDSVSLTWRAKPVVALPLLIKTCEPDFTLNPGSGFAQYLWHDGTSSSSYQVKNYGVYTVIVTDTNHCSNAASIEVLNACPGSIFVPNAFTPMNNDGLNQTFYPVVRNVKALQLQIYNRWGELIFETEELNKGWDGSYKKESANPDVYVYKINYTGMDEQTKTISGNVTLLK